MDINPLPEILNFSRKIFVLSNTKRTIYLGPLSHTKMLEQCLQLSNHKKHIKLNKTCGQSVKLRLFFSKSLWKLSNRLWLSLHFFTSSFSRLYLIFNAISNQCCANDKPIVVGRTQLKLSNYMVLHLNEILL